jgi:tetratricopeptide (TPR) repeat protein
MTRLTLATTAQILVLALLAGACGGSAATRRDAEHPAEREARTYEAYVRAQMARTAGDREAAVSWAREAVAASPEQGHLHLLLGRFLRELERFDEALAAAEAGLLAEPSLYELALLRADLLTALGDDVRIEPAYRDAIALDPDRIEAYVALAGHLDAKQRHGDAEQVLTEYLTRNPTDSEAWRALSGVLRDAGRIADAVEALARAVQGEGVYEDDFGVLISLSTQLNRFDDARRWGDECVVRFRRSLRCRIELIRAFEAEGGSAETVQQASYETLQSLGRVIGGNINQLRRVRYWIRQELGEQAALTFLSAVAADRPRNTQIQEDAAWQAYRVGEEELAVEFMERVLAVRPTDPDALNFIGYSFAERGIRLDEAEALVTQALAIRPLDGNIQDSLGWVYFMAGRIPEAVYWLKSANRLLPGNAVLMEHLADAWLGFGARAEAERLYRGAIEVAEDQGDRERIQRKLDELVQQAERES